MVKLIIIGSVFVALVVGVVAYGVYCMIQLDKAWRKDRGHKG